MLENESLQQAINESVRIFPYDPSWPQKFEDERTRLLVLFPRAFLVIEHIGSTAIPLLSAKPVIDLMAGVHLISEADAILPSLCENGYTTSAEFNATLINRRWFMRHSEGHRTLHLHLMIFGSNEWHRRINFREMLRANPKIFHQYQELKANLAKTVGLDREAYTQAKSEFIEKVLKGAL